ncbi:unnamed protein product [Paramecium primaurelia]|uniref:MORN repeat protein n=1 Tax=Paramecium primaurelia TaxID=5886 RepID=A0A8S1M4M5_PARPR|nr:unnamed protein product [Paramecium primaurelia]
MEEVQRYGQMELNMKEIISQVKSMAKASQILLMVLVIKVTGTHNLGEFYDNEIQGFGNYQWPDGRLYVGEWMRNKMHGKGEIKWPDGRKYKGEYENDKKHGKGVFIWEDGRKYIGIWQGGKQHGVGIYYSSDNVMRIGEWVEGKRVKWYDKEEINELERKGIIDDLRNQ